jgi:hypothetical protein
MRPQDKPSANRPGATVRSYAERNLYVLPLHTRSGESCSCGNEGCTRQGKHPRISGGHHRASVDSATIDRWFTAWPDANVGIACAKSGWVVLDVDPRNGGDQTLAKLIAELGPLPTTLTARTGGGGQHLVFRLPSGTRFAGQLGLGIDLKVNGYIVVEPSVTTSPYQWVTSIDQPIAQLPAMWLARLAPTGTTGPGRRPRAAHESEMPIPEGRRNTTLHKRASSMRRAGFSGAAITAAIAAENHTCCRPPLPDSEVRSIANSAISYLPPYFTSAADFFNDLRLTSSDRHVLRAITDHANADGCAFPSCETLASRNRALPRHGRRRHQATEANRPDHRQTTPIPIEPVSHHRLLSTRRSFLPTSTPPPPHW